MARILMCVSFAHKIGRKQRVSEGGRERFFSSYYPILSLVFLLLSSQSSHGRNASPFAETFLPTTRRVAPLWMHNLNNQAIVNFK